MDEESKRKMSSSRRQEDDATAEAWRKRVRSPYAPKAEAVRKKTISDLAKSKTARDGAKAFDNSDPKKMVNWLDNDPEMVEERHQEASPDGEIRRKFGTQNRERSESWGKDDPETERRRSSSYRQQRQIEGKPATFDADERADIATRKRIDAQSETYGKVPAAISKASADAARQSEDENDMTARRKNREEMENRAKSMLSKAGEDPRKKK